MAKEELKLEETFLNAALEQGVPLRLALANRERVAGRLSVVSRYDLVVESDGAKTALPKKEIFHITPSGQLLEDSFFPPPPDAAVLPPSRSRVQDDFLNRYIREKTLALLLLTNGEELRGVIEGYDGFTLSLRTGRGRILIYKHGICSLGPGYRRASREHAQQRP